MYLNFNTMVDMVMRAMQNKMQIQATGYDLNGNEVKEQKRYVSEKEHHILLSNGKTACGMDTLDTVVGRWNKTTSKDFSNNPCKNCITAMSSCGKEEEEDNSTAPWEREKK